MLAIALVPTFLLGFLLRLWVVHSPAAAVNADEAVTGLQGFDVLSGQYALMVQGNDYGGALESFLVAPVLLVSEGVLALKVVPVMLTLVAALSLAWTAVPLLGRSVALMVGVTSWVGSAVAVIISTLNYMGYASGVVAMTLALGCATRMMEPAQPRRPRWAFLGGLAAGVAMWAHPMFGVVSTLAFVPAVITNLRRLKVLSLLVGGGVLGCLPWLVHMVQEGPPDSLPSPFESTYAQRLHLTVTELVASGLGLRTGNGAWLEPSALSRVLAVVLLLAALTGLVLLRARRGPAAWPVLLAGWAAFPALAAFPAFGYTWDGRYALAFVPGLLIGLFAWTLFLPRRVVDSPVTLMTASLLWGVLACVPAIHQQVGWTWEDVNASTEELVPALEERGITAVRGDYWGVYVVDYFSQARLDSLPDAVVRLMDDAERVRGTDATRVGFIYPAGDVQSGSVTLPGAMTDYQTLHGGEWEAWILREP